jgi:imidazoleglycerol-phosphate dehydratase
MHVLLNQGLNRREKIKVREASIERKTNETDIALSMNIDGEGKSSIKTGVPFLEHMLDLFTKHGQFDLDIKANGDTEIDDHHTTEDIGICLGSVFKEALGDKKGIKRYGQAMVDALAQVVVDLSNRPHFELKGDIPASQVGTFDTELVDEFLWKFALEARMNLHVIIHYGRNTHHIIEAVFKALGRALDEATMIDPRVKGVPSTKGML